MSKTCFGSMVVNENEFVSSLGFHEHVTPQSGKKKKKKKRRNQECQKIDVISHGLNRQKKKQISYVRLMFAKVSILKMNNRFIVLVRKIFIVAVLQ